MLPLNGTDASLWSCMPFCSNTFTQPCLDRRRHPQLYIAPMGPDMHWPSAWKRHAGSIGESQESNEKADNGSEAYTWRVGSPPRVPGWTEFRASESPGLAMARSYASAASGVSDDPWQWLGTVGFLFIGC